MMIILKLGAAVTLALAATAPPLTLPAAVRYAIEHSPTLDSSRRQSAIAELQYRSATAAFLPSLDLTSNAGFKQTKLPGQVATPRPPWTSDVNLALSETLYDNGATITKHRVASLNADITRIAFEGARAKLTLDVSTSYYAYSLNQQLLGVSRGKTATLDKQFAQVSAQYRQGLRTRQDFLRFKTQLQQAQIDQTSAESGILSSEASLRSLLGVPAEDPKAPAIATDVPRPLDTAREVPLTAPPLENFYDVRSGRLQIQVNSLNENLVRRLWLPQIALTAGAAYDNSGSLGGPNPYSTNNTLSWTGQVALTYNIWDWGTRLRNVEIAEHTQAQGDDTVTSTILGARQNIDSLMIQLGTLSKNYRLNVELLELSQQSYTFLEEQYRLGKIQYLDLITGLNDLLTAKTQYLNSYYSLLETIAQYRYYEATIYERTINE